MNSSHVKRNSLATPSGSLSYFRVGEGPPLVMLHSLALSADMWLPIIDELIKSFEVIAVDLRGHGRSEYDGAPFTVEDMAGDLKILLDTLNLPKVHMLGMSMGGCVAINFAVTNPANVERLVLCDTTAWYGENAITAWNERAETALRRPRILQVPFQTDRWFAEGFRRTSPPVVSQVVDIFVNTKPQVHAYASLALGKFDNRSQLKNITATTLVITGDEDGATPPAMGQLLANEVPGASFVLGEGLRHFAIVESPALREMVINFLNGAAVAETPMVDHTPCCAAFDTFSHIHGKEL